MGGGGVLLQSSPTHSRADGEEDWVPGGGGEGNLTSGRGGWSGIWSKRVGVNSKEVSHIDVIDVVAFSQKTHTVLQEEFSHVQLLSAQRRVTGCGQHVPGHSDINTQRERQNHTTTLTRVSLPVE